MTQVVRIFIALFITVITFNISNAQLPVRTIEDINANPSATGGGMVYYSFKDSNYVFGADTLTNKWDIAFRSTTIWINGGSARFGNGGAIIKTNTTFDAEVLAPSTGYSVDGTTLAIPTGSDNGWYHYNPDAHTIMPIEGRVFLIRTGEGKYAKIQIMSYYLGGVPNETATNGGYYTFKYSYQPDGSGNLNSIVGITNIGTEIPKGFKLSQNFPNPFNPTTKIQFSVSKLSNVSLKVYDSMGKEIESLVNGNLNTGVYEVNFNAAGLSSGIYFYKLIANDFIETKKMLLTK